MNITGRWFCAMVLGLLVLSGTASLASVETFEARWDIVSIQGADAMPGGVAHAMARDGMLITFTGSGAFVARAGETGKARSVTGGGTWQIGGLTGSEGTYSVIDVVAFQPGPTRPPGTPAPENDLVGDPDEASAGFAVLRIAYSDGSEGLLVVSCRLQGTLDGNFQQDTAMMFEGVTATKGVAQFWRNFPIGDSNRALFHIRARGHDDDDDSEGRDRPTRTIKR
ncbi:MAG: hypothetical protein ACRDT1_00960 [Micromonosporaceae bacterium]